MTMINLGTIYLTESYYSITNYIPAAVLYILGLVYFITASLYLPHNSLPLATTTNAFSASRYKLSLIPRAK